MRKGTNIMNENNYGFMFNNITIKDDEFNKAGKNSLGKIKINNEIDFYLYIIKNNIDFPLPKLLNYKDGEISIEYISNSCILTNKINLSNMYNYIDRIKYYLNNIHKIQKPIASNFIKNDLNIELNTKILNRFNEFDWDSNILYKSIKSVNNVKIKNINYYCEFIQKKLDIFLKERNFYNLIHGDIHLGNTLFAEKDNIFFSSPRRYFRESKLFGLYEYDYAKLLFGLSGYSVFDNMIINDLNIINNNIQIDFIKQNEFIFEENLFDETTILLCLSIWLANNSCFSNINKKITSLMIAYYYCEKYLNKYSIF